MRVEIVIVAATLISAAPTADDRERDRKKVMNSGLLALLNPDGGSGSGGFSAAQVFDLDDLKPVTDPREARRRSKAAKRLFADVRRKLAAFERMQLRGGRFFWADFTRQFRRMRDINSAIVRVLRAGDPGFGVTALCAGARLPDRLVLALLAAERAEAVEIVEPVEPAPENEAVETVKSDESPPAIRCELDQGSADFLDTVVHAYETCLAKAAALGVDNEWVTQARRRRAELDTPGARLELAPAPLE